MTGTTTVQTNAAPTSPRSLSGLRLALFVAIALAARVLWLMQHGEGWDLPALLPLLILGELPLATAAVLVTRNQSHERIVRGAAIAFAASLAYLLLAPLLYLYAVLTIWDTGPWFRNLLALKEFIPITMAASGWLLASGFRQRGRIRKAFFAPVAWTLGYAVLAFPLMLLLAVRGSGAGNESKAYDRPARPVAGSTAIGPVAQIRAVDGCLLRHRFLHPEDGFPSSLRNIGADWNCNPEIANHAAARGFWLVYSPVTHLFTHGIADFRVQDIPAQRDTMQWEPLAADARGEIFGWQKLYGNAAFRKQTWGSESAFQIMNMGDSPAQSVYFVRDRLLAFMRTNGSGPPPSLEGVLNPQESTRFTCDANENPKTRFIRMDARRGCYTISYSPASSGTPSFAISAQCITYGDGCIRSYFLDYDGTVHATSEPRAATAQDSALLACETTIPCHDPVWTDSQQPSRWRFFTANLYYTLYTQNWW